MISCVFIVLCTLFYRLNSAVSDNKHELIQVPLLLDITTYTQNDPQQQIFTITSCSLSYTSIVKTRHHACMELLQQTWDMLYLMKYVAFRKCDQI